MRFDKFLRSTASAAVVGSVVFGFAGVAQAQDPAIQEEEQVSRVDDIIVTAQKREQSLQDVPIAISAISEADLSRSPINDVRALANVVYGAGRARFGAATASVIVISGEHGPVATLRLDGLPTGAIPSATMAFETPAADTPLGATPSE